MAEPTTKINEPIPRLIRRGRPIKGTNGHTNGHVVPSTQPMAEMALSAEKPITFKPGQNINLTINTPGKVVIIFGGNGEQPEVDLS